MFWGLLAPKPLGRFSNIFAELITLWTPSHMQVRVLGSIGSKGSGLRMREIVTLRRLFFSFFKWFMRLATGRPLGPIRPIIAVIFKTAQMTRPSGVHVLLWFR